MAEQYTSLKVIHDRITRHPLMQAVTMEAIIDYTIDFMRIVGVPAMFVNKVVEESTDNYRIKLPCDYVEMIQMKGKRGAYRYSTDTFHFEYKDKPRTNGKISPTIYPGRSCSDKCESCRFKSICDQYQFDFNKVECISFLRGNNNIFESHGKSNTFVIQNNYIYLSNKCDRVTISYRALLLDDEGIPMIPENSNFYRALVAYIKKEYFTVLFDIGVIQQPVLFQAQQDYAWAVGSCETDMLKMDLSKAESFLNSVKTIVNKNNEFASGFESNGDRVIFKRH